MYKFYGTFERKCDFQNLKTIKVPSDPMLIFFLPRKIVKLKSLCIVEYEMGAPLFQMTTQVSYP